MFVVSLLSVAGLFIFLYQQFNSIVDTSVNSNNSNNKYTEVQGITNILLVGVDARNINDTSRSDSMIIATLDNKNKSLKVTSLARDTYVNIPGYGMEKLTHAYYYGGISLLLDTIESNLNLDIHHYSIVNFNSFMDIIDTIGGVSIYVKDKDLKELNKIIKDSYMLQNNTLEGVQLIDESGIHKLNGYQTLAYSRIRKHDSGFERDKRQREVLDSLLTTLKKLPITKYPSLLNTILPNVKTDMLPKEILNLAFTLLSIGQTHLEQLEFPILMFTTDKVTTHNGWVLDFKREICLKVLHDFIFNDITYSDDDLRTLNKDIKSTYNSTYPHLNKKTSINNNLLESSDNSSNNKSDTNSNIINNSFDTDTNSEDIYLNSDGNLENDYLDDNYNIDTDDDLKISNPIEPNIPIDPIEPTSPNI